MPANNATQNYYEILGVGRSAKMAQIRRRYLTLTQEAHPDRFGDPGKKAQKAEEFKLINQAWEVLSDRDQRLRFDASLDSRTSFEPDQDSEASSSAIFNDAKRFQFTSQVELPKGLKEIMATHLAEVKQFEHRVITTFVPLSHTIGRSPLTSPCGQSYSVYLVLTNMQLIVAIEGKSEYEKSNTRHTVSYWRLQSIYLGAIERLDITASFDGCETGYSLRINAPESPFSGIDFRLKGSPFVFLWIADLFDIGIKLSLKPARPAAAQSVLVITGLLAGLGGLIAMIGDPATVVAGLCLSAAALAHGWAEYRQVQGEERLIQYCQDLLKRTRANVSH